MMRKDFDVWGYSLLWPQKTNVLPLLQAVTLTAEDIKFAYNAWCLLRLALFFGTGRPKVLSALTRTTPSMAIQHGGNRLFYMHAEVDAQLSSCAHRVALCPSHPTAHSVSDFPWHRLLHNTSTAPQRGVELVVGMENGMSATVEQQCKHKIYIPQYGSIGSLSMLSALAIAAHYAAQAHYDRCMQPLISHMTRLQGRTAALGHMPLSNQNKAAQEAPPRGAQRHRPLPHEANLLHCSNAEIKALLSHRRTSYALQLGVVMYNELGDRNIGAVMRNANAFNCACMHIVHRRRFNRRGSVGTHNLLDVHFHNDAAERSFVSAMEGYAVWMLYPYYPYLHIHGEDEERQASFTFLRHSDPLLQRWLSASMSCATLNLHGKKRKNIEEAKECNAVFLDDDYSTYNAVKQVVAQALCGIMLAVPEEGCTLHPSLAMLCTKIVYVCHPQRTAHATQRGLTPALATAIALQRLRHAIDCL